MQKVATFHSPLTTKFGTPRQAGVVAELTGSIVFEKPFRSADAIRGMEGFDYLWLIWGFSQNNPPTSIFNFPLGSAARLCQEFSIVNCPSLPPGGAGRGLTVRPPRLGGNERVGVFASRSPYRPNPIGLSSVLIDHIDFDCPDAPVIHVKGADLIDGTPIYDIKPYIPYTDSHPDARSGFVDQREWQPLSVALSEEAEEQLLQPEYTSLQSQLPVLKQLLAQDPRPHYHTSSERIYAMQFSGYDVSFQVRNKQLTIVKIKKT